MEYKIYSLTASYESTHTYTDITDYIKNNPPIPVLNINPDQTPIFQQLNLLTIEDLRLSTLAVGKIVCCEINSIKCWYGYVESTHLKQHEYTYTVLNIFEKLKEITCYTDLFAELASLGTHRVSDIYSGVSSITWDDITVKELIEKIFEADFYNGLTNVLTWDLDTNITTVLENICVSSLCIKHLGTDYSDEDLTEVSADPDFLVYDLFIQLLKDFGVRFYYTGAGAVKAIATDTEPGTTDYRTENDIETNDYDYNDKKPRELKRFVAKQNILNIIDNANSENEHRYFSPVMYGIPNFRVDNIIDNIEDTDIDLYTDHKIPLANTMLTKIKMINAFDKEYESIEEWSRKDVDEIKLLETSIIESRYAQANLGTRYAITNMTKPADSKIITITAPGHGLASSNYNITVSCYGLYYSSNDLTKFINGTYTYESGTGTPSGAGKYREDGDNSTIHIYIDIDITSSLNIKQLLLYGKDFTLENDYIQEKLASVGDPKYISRTYRDTVDNGAGGTITVTVVQFGSAGHGMVITDRLYLLNTKGLDLDGGYIGTSTLATISTGYYYIKDADEIYLYDPSSTGYYEDFGVLKPLFTKYQNYKNLTTGGKEDQAVNMLDYLVYYRPNYSEDEDWKEDWWVIDMEDATYCLLLQSALYSPWWLYSYNQAYQFVMSEKYNLDDTVTPVMTTARKVIYDMDDLSIDIEQDVI